MTMKDVYSKIKLQASLLSCDIHAGKQKMRQKKLTICNKTKKLNLLPHFRVYKDKGVQEEWGNGYYIVN